MGEDRPESDFVRDSSTCRTSGLDGKDRVSGLDVERLTNVRSSLGFRLLLVPCGWTELKGLSEEGDCIGE